MGRTNSCLDNAVAESFFATVRKLSSSVAAATVPAPRRGPSIFGWIAWYDRRRLHSTIGYLPPVEWEQRHATLNPSPSTMAA
jgi:transposase InsO family protein